MRQLAVVEKKKKEEGEKRRNGRKKGKVKIKKVIKMLPKSSSKQFVHCKLCLPCVNITAAGGGIFLFAMRQTNGILRTAGH